ncbi:hypothetical protein GCM10027174_36720 [Salinifilum aidingensis]
MSVLFLSTAPFCTALAALALAVWCAERRSLRAACAGVSTADQLRARAAALAQLRALPARCSSPGQCGPGQCGPGRAGSPEQPGLGRTGFPVRAGLPARPGFPARPGLPEHPLLSGQRALRPPVVWPAADPDGY